MKAVLSLALSLSACASTGAREVEEVFLFQGDEQQIQRAAEAARRCRADVRIAVSRLGFLELLLQSTTPPRAQRCLVRWYYDNPPEDLVVNISFDGSVR